jgi:hypothetical protein
MSLHQLYAQHVSPMVVNTMFPLIVSIISIEGEPLACRRHC